MPLVMERLLTYWLRRTYWLLKLEEGPEEEEDEVEIWYDAIERQELLRVE